jgi:hypothetical protein
MRLFAGMWAYCAPFADAATQSERPLRPSRWTLEIANGEATDCRPPGCRWVGLRPIGLHQSIRSGPACGRRRPTRCGYRRSHRSCCRRRTRRRSWRGNRRRNRRCRRHRYHAAARLLRLLPSPTLREVRWAKTYLCSLPTGRGEHGAWYLDKPPIGVINGSFCGPAAALSAESACMAAGLLQASRYQRSRRVPAFAKCARC